jgi:hypothetical protein
MAEIDDILSVLRHRIMRPWPQMPKHRAVISLRRLAHPERDGGVAEEHSVSQLIRRLVRDMPELLEEIVALVEYRIAELNGAPRPTESVAPVKPAVAARFGAMAATEGMSYGEFLEHMLNVFEASKKKTDDADARLPRRLILMEAPMREQERAKDGACSR